MGLDDPSGALTARLDTPGDGTDTTAMEQERDALHNELILSAEGAGTQNPRTEIQIGPQPR